MSLKPEQGGYAVGVQPDPRIILTDGNAPLPSKRRVKAIVKQMRARGARRP